MPARDEMRRCRWCGKQIGFNRTIRKWVTGGVLTKNSRCGIDATTPVRVHEPEPDDE